MPETEDLFVRGILEAYPVFRADLDRELRLYGEPTSSRFVLALPSHALDRYLKGGPVEAEQFRGLVAYMEEHHGTDPEIDELIESRFVELLPEPGGPDDQVLDLLGPKLREARVRLDREARAVPESLTRFVERLAVAVPPAREKLAAHVQEYRWVLPHTFLEDVVAEVRRLFLAGRIEEIRPFLEFLESEFGLDAEVDNLIAVSFIDELPRPGEPGADIERLLGPKLRGELERQRNWPG